MSTARVFLLASSLARLIEKERGGQLIRQGYFPERPSRCTYVQVKGETGQLILISHQPNDPVEEVTDLPRSQAEALLDLAVGQVEYLNVGLTIGGQPVTLRRFLTPGPLDLITVTFEQSKQALQFEPLAWFGPEVTEEPAYQSRTMALAGLSSAREVEITAAALHSLLDTLDGRVGSHEPQAIARQPVAPSRSAEAEAEAEAEDEQDQDDLNLEDSVIRDLARSLRPRRR
jgi:CYTH domain-containing protein